MDHLLLSLFLVLPALILASSLLHSRPLPSIPSPSSGSLPFLGHALSFLLSPLPPSLVLANLSSSLGPISQISIFRERLVLLCDRGAIERVLVGKEWKAGFDRGGFFINVFASVLGDKSMLCLRSDPTFTSHRKLFFPSFSSSTISKDVFPILNDKIDHLLASWPTHEAFDAEHSLALLTKEMVLATIFGVDMALLRDPSSEGHHVVDWIEVVFNSLSPIPVITTIKRLLDPRYHLARYKLFRWMDVQLDAGFESLVNSNPSRTSNWSMLSDVLSRSEGYTRREIRDELFTMLLAGDDTTASQLCWILNHLRNSPKTQDRLREELESLPRDVTFDHVMEKEAPLPILSAVVAESLRLAGTIPLTSREATRDTFLLSGGDADGREPTRHPVPKGTTLVILLDALGKDGESGEDFDIDRWLDSEGHFDSSRVDSHPFSLGTRACFGVRLAQVFLRLFVVRVVTSVEIRRSPSEEGQTSEGEESHRSIRVKESISRRPVETKVWLESKSVDGL